MTHEEALNKILAHTCPVTIEENLRWFHLDLCHYQVIIKAQVMKLEKSNDPIRYEIISLEVVHND